MFDNIKISRVLLIVVSIATTMIYGSEKPNNAPAELIVQVQPTSQSGFSMPYRKRRTYTPLFIQEPNRWDPRRWDRRTQKCAAAVASVALIGTCATIAYLTNHNLL